MQVNSYSDVVIQNTTNNKIESVNTDNESINSNDFFKLIAAQLQNQTMYNPVDDTQFMSQMAQFTTLQQIQELNSSFQSSYAISLIGRNVITNSKDENGIMHQITGIVDKVSFKDKVAMLSINGNDYNASDVIEIKV